MFKRAVAGEVRDGLVRFPQFVHVLVGPRQVGKTTAAEQVMAELGWPSHLASADAPLPPGPEWVETQWARAQAGAADGPRLLVLDEIQKVRGWSEIVKRVWDEGRRRKSPVRVLLLGSSALLLQRGLGESLAGRFVLHRCTHWDWPECRAAFGWSLEDWLFYGGYPGAAAFFGDEERWRRYIADSLVDSVLTRDIFQLQQVAKPALLRHLFGLAVAFPAQIFSYNKMLGQLTDAGNTTTLAHYLELLATAFLVTGLELYSAGQRRKRGSSPKLVAWNNALINAYSGLSCAASRMDAAWRGRLVENAVGARLLNHLRGPEWNVTYWRRGNEEVDYVVQRGRQVWALEVKSGRAAKAPGLAAFSREYPKAGRRQIGDGSIPLEEFFSEPVGQFLE